MACSSPRSLNRALAELNPAHRIVELEHEVATLRRLLWLERDVVARAELAADVAFWLQARTGTDQ